MASADVTLTNAIKMTDAENKIKELEDTIAFLKSKLAFEIRKNAGDKILLDYYTRLFSAGTANYLIDPDPINLACSGTKSGTSCNYLVKVKNIVAIKSDGRLKNIFLAEAQSPLEGGEKKNVIYYNNNDADWNDLLLEIQRGSQFLFRVHRSFAINVFHYTLDSDNTFKINKKLEKKTDSIIHVIKTDSQFNSEAYHKRLLEVKYLFDSQAGFALDYQKLQEISRYIESQEITTEPK